MADIIAEGQITRQFMFVNLANYKGFSFSYKYYSYHYSLGYQPNTPVLIKCVENHRYEAGSRFYKTKLEAKDAAGNMYKSNIEIGGDSRISTNKISAVVDVFTVESIKDGVIKLKKTDEITVYKNGKETKRKLTIAGSVTNSGGDNTAILVGGALAAIVSLLFVFFINKRQLQK